MREIKFRYYFNVDLPNRKTFHRDATLNQIEDRKAFNGVVGWGNCKYKMQYTGLLDKNDEPIYEGDVVRCKLQTDKDYWLAEAKWCLDAWCLGLHTMSSYVDIEVIGNIYENKKIIKGLK
jgi:hypothetical protein